MNDLAGKPVLEHVIKRVKASTQLDNVMVATTTEARDDTIADYCTSQNIPFYRGSETNVLERYIKSAELFSPNVIVRITSDCPLISPLIIDQAIEHFIATDADYVSTNYPTRTYPVGLDTEVVKASCLQKAYKEATSDHDKEHVTPYLYTNPKIFHCEGLNYQEDLSHLSITLDTKEDYERITKFVRDCPESLDPLADMPRLCKTHL